jgi:hypothetical protein
MKNYRFIVYLNADAETPEEAWRTAVEAFSMDPGEPETYSYEELPEDTD